MPNSPKDLLAELRRIDAQTQALHVERGQIAADLARIRHGVRPARSSHGRPLVERIVGLMNAQAELVWTVDEVAAALSGHSSKRSVSTTLANLARDGRVNRVERGCYQSIHGVQQG